MVSAPADQYPLAELKAFLAALRDAGVEFLTTDMFAARARDHFASAAPGHPNPPFGLVKCDLHRDIKKPLEVAHALAEAKVPTVFLMMHRHPFNAAFFDSAATWDVLRAIAGLNHEIGLHLDPFHLIRTFGDLYSGLAAALDDFRKRGFTVRSATLHGDTSKHITACGLNARDFFLEDKGRSTWNGIPPSSEEGIADHVGRYSYADLATRFGIVHMAEAAYRHDGELLSARPLVYVTDNNRSLQVRNIPNADGTVSVLDAGERFRIPPGFAQTAFEPLRAHPFLALFHPQWFWSDAG